MKAVSYLRVSTSDQDNAKCRAAVIAFAAGRGFPKPRFTEETASGKTPWRERKLGALIDGLKPKDVLIVSELSRLGRSLSDILDILQTARSRGASIYAVKENTCLNGDTPMERAMSSLLGVFAELERDLCVMRVREGLAHARARGVRLGRPKGTGQLDPHKKDIMAAYRGGARIAELGRRYGVIPNTMRYFLLASGARLRVHGWR